MTSPTTSRPTILVVDDVEDNRIILSRRLSKKGYVVLEAADGYAALDIVANDPVDLILLDVMMPNLNGMDVLRRLREKFSREELPVIMVTARTSADDIVEALQAGANDYITKPVEMSVASARIEVQFERMGAQRALRQSLLKLTEINRQLECEVAERKRSDDRIAYLSYHDPATGLGNGTLLRDRIEHLLQRHSAAPVQAALMAMELSRYRDLVATYGQVAADAAIIEIANRLRNAARDSDTIARTGANQFFVLLSGFRHPGDAEPLIEQVSDCFTRPFAYCGHEISLPVCCGVALAPGDGNHTDTLIENAILTLEQARTEGSGSRCYFEAGLNARAHERRSLRTDLQRAIGSNQFELYFQPLYNLARKSVSGYEALVRWRHPERGIMSPAQFIPLSEETGLIIPLGDWILNQACTAAADWPDDTRVAVNISGLQFREPGFIQTVECALAASGLAPNRLELEITETILIDDDANILRAFQRLRALGVRISLDDFGTGYSSLSYIHRFPLNKLKIDQSFVRNLGNSSSSEPIVNAILGVANALGIDTTAEGIETEDQMHCLQRLGCGEIQGYLISKPMPLSALPCVMSGQSKLAVA